MLYGMQPNEVFTILQYLKFVLSISFITFLSLFTEAAEVIFHGACDE